MWPSSSILTRRDTGLKQFMTKNTAAQSCLWYSIMLKWRPWLGGCWSYGLLVLLAIKRGGVPFCCWAGTEINNAFIAFSKTMSYCWQLLRAPPSHIFECDREAERTGWNISLRLGDQTLSDFNTLKFLTFYLCFSSFPLLNQWRTGNKTNRHIQSV